MSPGSEPQRGESGAQVRCSAPWEGATGATDTRGTAQSVSGAGGAGEAGEEVSRGCRLRLDVK